jgi:hypothetical protein
VKRQKNYLRDSWHVLMLTALFFMCQQFYYYMTSEPDPYSNVEVQSVERVDEGYLVTATFTKNACEFKRLEVFGVTTLTLELLDWHNAENDPVESETYDRSAGFQVLVLIAEAEHDRYTGLEIRTRHDCGGETVDKLFAAIDL